MNFFFHRGFDDLVFEHRNQAYGAYQLRQKYPEHLTRALLYALSFLFIFALYSRIRIPHQPSLNPGDNLIIVDLLSPVNQASPRSTAAPAIPKSRSKPSSLLQIEDKPETIINHNTSVDEVPSDLPEGEAKPGEVMKSGTNLPTVSDEESGRKVWNFVEQLPEFPGGQKALNEFLLSNMRSPSLFGDEEYSGKVLVSFIIESDGRVSNAKIEKGKSQSLNREVLRLIDLMPKWTPGIQNGRAVRVMLRLPIEFKAGD